MMLDDLHPNDGLGPRMQPLEPERPLADREIPLAGATKVFSAAMHAWLDGELAEVEVRRVESASDVELWRRIVGEALRLRRTRAPRRLEAAIMGALPTR